MEAVIPRAFGSLWLSDSLVASLRKDVFLILVLSCQVSIILLHGLFSSILSNLSKVSTVALSLRTFRGSTLASISQAHVGVVLSPPQTNRRAWFCSLSSFSWFVVLAVACRGAEWSKTARIYPVYSCRRVVLFGPQFELANLFRRFSLFATLATISPMCVLKVSLGSSRTPR